MKEGWTYRQLKDVTNKISDGSHNPPKGIAYSEYPMLSSKNILFDDFNYDSPRYLSKEDFDIENKRTDISDGDVLLTIVGTVGRTCCVQNPFIPFTLQRSVAVLKPKKEILISRFLMYVLYSLTDLWDNEAKGAAQKGVYLKQLAAVSIPTPPIAEQEQIVERLDAAFAQIDELKSNAERQLAEARALFQSALTQAMQPKPGWQEKTLVNVCDIFGRIGFRGYTTKDLVSSQNDGAISLSPSNIQNGEMDYSKRTYISWFKYNESPEIKIFNGDILLVKTGSSYGKSALVKDLPHEATINPQSVVLKNFRINNEFFAYQLRTERVKKEFDQFVSGTAIPTFSQAKLGTVPIYFPSEIEQEQIVSYLNSLNNHVKELEEISRKTAADCDAMKQALLRQIFE